MSRVDELRRMDQAFSRLTRLASGRVAARTRAERSGVMLSGPAITVIGALQSSGPVRLSSLARLTGLEAPLISREIRELGEAGYVFRSSDPTDGRAGIVELTAKGADVWKRYRAAADAISAEAFAEWSTDDLHTLRVLLERMARDVVNVPRSDARQSRAS